MTSYRICGQPWDYASLPGEENSRDGWRMVYAVLGPRETPTEGMRVALEGVDYAVARWTTVAYEDAPDPCRRRDPGQGIFELVLEPLG